MTANSGSHESSSGVAAVYGKIAQKLGGLKEIKLALQVCDRGIKKYPDNPNLYVIKSQIQILQFNKESSAGLLKTIFSNLEIALKLDPQSYIAKILASQVLLKGRAHKKAKALLADILRTFPDDEKAGAMMAVIEKSEKKKAAKAKPAPKEKAPAPKVEETAAQGESDDTVPSDEAAYSPKSEDVIVSATAGEADESREKTDEDESGQWTLDDKLVIDTHEGADEALHLEALSSKLTIFGRLDGILAIFLVNDNGQPIKTINKEKVDENILPSFVFNLYKASVSGTRRTGYGSFQQGTLVSAIGTIIIVNAFYATLALVIDNDANLSAIQARVQRYLEEITK